MTKDPSELIMITPDRFQSIHDLDLLYIRKLGSYKESVSEAWKEMMTFIHQHKLDKKEIRYFGVAYDDPRLKNEDELRYDACISTSQTLPDEHEIAHQMLKGGRYAIFTHNGSYDGLEETFDRIFLKWLPDSNEQLDESRAIFEEYFNVEYVNNDESKLVTEIYVPIAS